MTQEQIHTFARELALWTEQVMRDVNALALQARMIQNSTEPPEPPFPEVTSNE